MLKPDFPSNPNILIRRGGEIGLLLLCLFLFFWRLGDARLFDLDEGVYVSCARNMALSGNYVTPRINSRPHDRPEQQYTPFFEKPPMVYWLSAVSLRVFGISEGAARLPVALASLLATALVVWAGGRWFGRRAGLLAGLVYATVPMTVLDARQMTTDALLTLWFLLAMLGYLERRPVLFWVACALAVLTKGIVGLLLPGLVIGVFQLTVWFLTRRLHREIPPLHPPQKRRTTAHVLGLLLFLLITIPWHVAIWKAGGRDLNKRNWVQEYIIRQHVGRFKGQDIHHNAPPPTYLAYFLIGFFPWACFTPFAFRQKAERAEEKEKTGNTGNTEETGGAGSAVPPGNGDDSREADRGEPNRSDAVKTAHSGAHRPPLPTLPHLPVSTLSLFLLCWFWTIFLFFSASAAKLPTYIVPVYPAAALLVGKWLARQMERNEGEEPGKGLQIGAFAALLTSALLLLVVLLLPQFTRSRPVMPPAAAALALLITLLLTFGCLAGWFCLRRARRSLAWLRAGIGTLAATMTLLIALIAGPGYAVANRWIFGPYQDLAILARPDAKEGLPVIYYDFGDRRPSMLFYARDYSPIERKEEPLLPFLRPYLPAKNPAADIITLRSTFEQQLKPELDAAGWNADLIAVRDSSLATWILIRIYPRNPALSTLPAAWFTATGGKGRVLAYTVKVLWK